MSTVSSLQRSDFDERRLLWFASRFASFVRRRFRRKGHRRASDRRQRGDPLDPYGVNDLNARRDHKRIGEQRRTRRLRGNCCLRRPPAARDINGHQHERYDQPQLATVRQASRTL
jgi:hypothetical protein